MLSGRLDSSSLRTTPRLQDFFEQNYKRKIMTGPYENDSLEYARIQMTERWEQDVSELEPEDWEFHFGGCEDADAECLYPDGGDE